MGTEVNVCVAVRCHLMQGTRYISGPSRGVGIAVDTRPGLPSWEPSPWRLDM